MIRNKNIILDYKKTRSTGSGLQVCTYKDGLAQITPTVIWYLLIHKYALTHFN